MTASDLPVQVVAAERDLTAEEARTLTQEIRQHVAEIELRLVQAWQGRAWLALGYPSWDEYIAGEFKAAPLALPRQERRAAVQSLRGWGLSTRAIASATGESQQLIHNDLQVTKNLSPKPTPVTGLDGKSYQPRTGPSTRPDPAPTITTACPTCGGTGRVTQ